MCKFNQKTKMESHKVCMIVDNCSVPFGVKEHRVGFSTSEYDIAHLAHEQQNH